MTWLVTGGTGFLGRHVLSTLGSDEQPGRRVVALGRRHPGGWPLEDFVRIDLDDRDRVARAIRDLAPEVVIHTAGKTPPAPSLQLYLANTRATAILLHSIQSVGRPCRVVLAGSAAELGPVPVDHLPVAEDHPCRPSDAYGLSKWAASRLGLSMPAPLDVIAARIFNPIGPGLPSSQAFGRFASAIAAASPDPMTLRVGNLEARRDFVDVRDVARALILLAERGHARTIYHIGTGASRSVGDGLRELIRLSGRDVRIEEQGPSRGPSDSRADVRRIAQHVGWSPEIPWETSLADLWREACRTGPARRVA